MGGNLSNSYLYKPGDNHLAWMLETSSGITATTPTKVGNTFNAKVSGNIRVSFKLGTNNAGQTANARIYKNGVAFGTLRTTTALDASPTLFTEDIFVSRNDTIDVRIWQASGMCTLRESKVTIENVIYTISA